MASPHNPGCSCCSCLRKHFKARDIPWPPPEHTLDPVLLDPNILAVDLANHGYRILDDFALKRTGTELAGLPQWTVGMKLHVASEKIWPIDGTPPSSLGDGTFYNRFDTAYEIVPIRQEIRLYDGSDAWIATVGMTIEYDTIAYPPTEDPFDTYVGKPIVITLDFTDGTVSRYYDFYYRHRTPFDLSSNMTLARYTLSASDWYWYFPRLNVCRKPDGDLSVLATSPTNDNAGDPLAYGFTISGLSWINAVANWEIAVVDVPETSYSDLTPWILEEWYFASGETDTTGQTENVSTFPYGKNETDLCIACETTLTCNCADLPTEATPTSGQWPTLKTSFVDVEGPGQSWNVAATYTYGAPSTVVSHRTDKCFYIAVIERTLTVNTTRTRIEFPFDSNSAEWTGTQQTIVKIKSTSTGLHVELRIFFYEGFILQDDLTSFATWDVVIANGDLCAGLTLNLAIEDATIFYGQMDGDLANMLDIGESLWLEFTDDLVIDIV